MILFVLPVIAKFDDVFFAVEVFLETVAELYTKNIVGNAFDRAEIWIAWCVHFSSTDSVTFHVSMFKNHQCVEKEVINKYKNSPIDICGRSSALSK